MKFKKIFICLFAFSIFLTSCYSKTNNNSNNKVEEESKQKKKKIENVELEEEIKKVEFPENATAVSWSISRPGKPPKQCPVSRSDAVPEPVRTLW